MSRRSFSVLGADRQSRRHQQNDTKVIGRTWRAQRAHYLRLLAEGGIVPSMRAYLQREYKITDQDVAELEASGSH